MDYDVGGSVGPNRLGQQWANPAMNLANQVGAPVLPGLDRALEIAHHCHKLLSEISEAQARLLGPTPEPTEGSKEPHGKLDALNALLSSLADKLAGTAERMGRIG